MKPFGPLLVVGYWLLVEQPESVLKGTLMVCPAGSLDLRFHGFQRGRWTYGSVVSMPQRTAALPAFRRSSE